MNEDFLKIISGFADINTRAQAAKDLAALFHAEDIFCFYFDGVVNTYLPAPGFPQTLSNAKEWQKFLLAGENKESFQGSLLLHGEKQTLCIASKDKCIMAIVGANPSIEVENLKIIFPLFATIIKSESINKELLGKINSAERTTRKSEELTKYLDNARSKLQEALKTEEEFLSVASHELKTPVTSINGFIQVLQQLYPANKNERTHYILARTKSQVDRLIMLISDLLDATKIKIGKLALNVEEEDLNNIIDELIQDHLTTITSHQIIKKGLVNTKIKCDKNRIEQVMSNLLTNAIKYSQNADKIIVTTSEDNYNAYVDVQDFGIGIEPESVPKIFNRFYRAHGEDGGMLSSLGLGLFISADIIKRHNGKIWVDSEPGKGSIFHFSLPKN